MSDPLALLVELLSAQPVQAPGSAESTRRALSMVGPLPPRPRIADLGCGRGASALVLAAETGGDVLALDLLPQMVAATRALAAADGLADRLTVVQGDMADPPIEPGSLDLLWSEGAAYSIGFRRALGLWRPLLRDGGAIGVSELCWRPGDPPDGARAFWQTAYPDMGDAPAAEAALVDAGFTLVGAFWLPRSDWAAYYEPLRAVLPAFRMRHAGDAVAAQVADELAAEVAAWERWGAAYGYRFLVGRA